MYQEFFSLKGAPFSLVPDESSIFWTEQHSCAFATLQSSLADRAAITVLTGEIGTGKTTLIRCLLQSLPANLTVGLLSNFLSGKVSLRLWALMAFDQCVTEAPDAVLLERLQVFLAGEAADGRHPVLIIDEAQNLSSSDLEEVCSLALGFSTSPMSVVLVGQPGLCEMLKRPECRQTAQNLGTPFHLTEFSLEDTLRYVQHRCRHAGAATRLFTRPALEEVHRISGGIPRKVNVVCHLCMSFAFAGNTRTINAPLVRSVIDEARRNGVFAALTDGSSVPSQNSETSPLGKSESAHDTSPRGAAFFFQPSDEKRSSAARSSFTGEREARAVAERTTVFRRELTASIAGAGLATDTPASVRHSDPPSFDGVPTSAVAAAPVDPLPMEWTKDVRGAPATLVHPTLSARDAGRRRVAILDAAVGMSLIAGILTVAVVGLLPETDGSSGPPLIEREIAPLRSANANQDEAASLSSQAETLSGRGRRAEVIRENALQSFVLHDVVSRRTPSAVISPSIPRPPSSAFWVPGEAERTERSSGPAVSLPSNSISPSRAIVAEQSIPSQGMQNLSSPGAARKPDRVAAPAVSVMVGNSSPPLHPADGFIGQTPETDAKPVHAGTPTEWAPPPRLAFAENGVAIRRPSHPQPPDGWSATSATVAAAAAVASDLALPLTTRRLAASGLGEPPRTMTIGGRAHAVLRSEPAGKKYGVLPGSSGAAEAEFHRALEIGVDDPAAAVLGYTLSALRGHPRGAYYLGQLYETGDGVPIDYALARAWYEHAAPLGGHALSTMKTAPEPELQGPITPPLLLFGQRLDETHAEFVWTSGEGADPAHYVVQIAADPERGAISSFRSKLSAAALQIPPETVYWRVLAFNVAKDTVSVTTWNTVKAAVYER